VNEKNTIAGTIAKFPKTDFLTPEALASYIAEAVGIRLVHDTEVTQVYDPKDGYEFKRLVSPRKTFDVDEPWVNLADAILQQHADLYAELEKTGHVYVFAVQLHAKKEAFNIEVFTHIGYVRRVNETTEAG